MSYRTWCDEFIPDTPGAMSYTEAIALSRKKWDGLLPSSLKRHKIDPTGATASLLRHIIKSGVTCALCEKARLAGDATCDQCPISIYDVDCPSDGSAYDIYCHTGNYAPMRKLLRELTGWWPKWIKHHKELD